MTLRRHEHERVANEIQLQYKHKMLLLRQEMDARRKKEIERIEDKKNKAIEDLVKMIEKKYNDIKTYYRSPLYLLRGQLIDPMVHVSHR